MASIISMHCLKVPAQQGVLPFYCGDLMCLLVYPSFPTCPRWLPQETADTLKRYQTALAQSELTLCPVGINTECYRIYEACSYGSVPVVEDVLTPGSCAAGPSSPLRLLKAAGAPFIFVSDWKVLPVILERERKMTQEQRVDRRRRLLEWYSSFRQQMKERFTEVIEENFFKNGWILFLNFNRVNDVFNFFCDFCGKCDALLTVKLVIFVSFLVQISMKAFIQS